MGIAGSALATLIAQVGEPRRHSLVHLYRAQAFPVAARPRAGGYLKPDRVLLRALVFKGLPMGLQMIVHVRRRRS